MNDDGTRIMSDAEMDAADRLAEKRLAEARARPADSDVDARVRQYLQRPYRMEVRGNAEEGYLATAPLWSASSKASPPLAPRGRPFWTR